MLIFVSIKVVNIIDKQIRFFFITLIINLFITFYSIYNFLDFVIFQNKQGLKLNIKKETLHLDKEEKER